MEIVGPIEVGEIKAIRFDFSTEAAEITTLNTPAVTPYLLEGTDPSFAAVLVGTPTIEGKFVVQKVQPGVVGCTYKLVAFVADSSGLRHRISTKFSVVPG